MMGVGSSCSLGVASLLWENCGCQRRRSPVARAGWGPWWGREEEEDEEEDEEEEEEEERLLLAEARIWVGRLKIISSQSSSRELAGTHCLVLMENTRP